MYVKVYDESSKVKQEQPDEKGSRRPPKSGNQGCGESGLPTKPHTITDSKHLLTVLRQLNLPLKPEFTFTKDLNDQVMLTAKESQEANLMVQYCKQLKPGNEL